MRDPFRPARSASSANSIVIATLLCLVATTAPLADESKTREIIETDFAATPASRAGEGQASTNEFLPADQPPLLLVPVDLIGSLPPTEAYRGPLGSSDGGVAGSNGAGAAHDGSSDGGSSDGSSSGTGSNGGQAAGGGSGGSGSGGGDPDGGGLGGGGLGGLAGGLAEGVGGLVGGLRDGLDGGSGGGSASGGKNGND